MLNTILSYFVTNFLKKCGVLFEIILTTSTTTLIKDILNKENQLKAYEFVRFLNNREDLTNTQKRRLFNSMMLKWAKLEHKNIKDSVINCLRELAVSAIKKEKCESCKI